MPDLQQAAQLVLQPMDLTTLNDNDTDASVIALCHQAKTPAVVIQRRVCKKFPVLFRSHAKRCVRLVR